MKEEKERSPAGNLRLLLVFRLCFLRSIVLRFDPRFVTFTEALQLYRYNVCKHEEQVPAGCFLKYGPVGAAEMET